MKADKRDSSRAHVAAPPLPKKQGFSGSRWSLTVTLLKFYIYPLAFVNHFR